MANSITRRCIIFVLLCGILSPLPAQHVGEAVRIQHAIADVPAPGSGAEGRDRSDDIATRNEG